MIPNFRPAFPTLNFTVGWPNVEPALYMSLRPGNYQVPDEHHGQQKIEDPLSFLNFLVIQKDFNCCF